MNHSKWPYKNHLNEAFVCQYYKYILGGCWSELTELFLRRWSPKYFRELHISLTVWRFLCCGYWKYLFPCTAKLKKLSAWTRQSNNQAGVMWGGVIPYKIIQALFSFCCHLCCLCSKFILFYWLWFLLLSDLVTQIILPKVSEECTTILQLKVHNIHVVQKTSWITTLAEVSYKCGFKFVL